MRIIQSEHLVEKIEDWAKVRSPSRAKRRLARGFRQNIVKHDAPATYCIHDKINDAIIVHPVRFAELRARLNKDCQTAIEKSIRGE